MALVGLVGWRGMVGSVLLDRMQAEGDFALIEPVFFSTSNAGGAAPKFAKNETKLFDANDIAALKRCDIVISSASFSRRPKGRMASSASSSSARVCSAVVWP